MTHRISLATALTALCVLGSACSPPSAETGQGTGGASGAAAGTGSGGASAGNATGGKSAGGASGNGGAGAASATGGSSAGQASGAAAGNGGALASGGNGAGGSSGDAGGAITGGTAGQMSSGGAAGSAGTMSSGGMGGSGGTGVIPGNACTGTASGSAANTLTVNVDTAKDVVNSGIFGLLMERLGKNWNGGLFVGTNSSIPNTNGMRDDVIQAFKDAGVGMIEFPGGCAAGSYNWSANKAPSNDVGTDRYMELCGLLGIPPLIVGPGTSAAAANNLAWVTYINQNSAHPEWTLNHFKVGNEVWGCGGNQDEATYEANYLANYDQLLAPVNGKKLNIIAGTGLIGNWDWFDEEVKNLAGKIDGVEVHDYIYHPDDIPNVGFSDAQYYNVVNAANAGQIGPRIDRVVQTLDQYDPDKHIKIYEDEWGDWLQNFASGDDWLQQGTVMDGISAAETLHLFMKHADRYAMAGLAQGINVIHSLLLTRSSDAALVKTPTFYVFQLFLPHHRANAKWAPNVLKSENITGNNQTFPVVSAGSTVDDQGHVNVSLANVDLENSRTVEITINGGASGYAASAQVITGPAKDSYNDFAQTEKVNIQPLTGSDCSVSGKTVEITLPSKSVAMLVLTPTP